MRGSDSIADASSVLSSSLIAAPSPEYISSSVQPSCSGLGPVGLAMSGSSFVLPILLGGQMAPAVSFRDLVSRFRRQRMRWTSHVCGMSGGEEGMLRKGKRQELDRDGRQPQPHPLPSLISAQSMMFLFNLKLRDLLPSDACLLRNP